MSAIVSLYILRINLLPRCEKMIAMLSCKETEIKRINHLNEARAEFTGKRSTIDQLFTLKTFSSDIYRVR